MVNQRRKRDAVMAKISNTKKYAILYLHESQKKSVEDISKELKITKAVVNSVIEPTKTIEKEDKTKNVMIRQTAGKKSNTVSIMTHAASQISDEHIKNMSNTTPDTSSFIFRPRSTK
jgi:hypothetical protein